MSQYENIKTFMQEVTFQIGPTRFLWLRKLQTLCRWNVLEDRNGEHIVETFDKKE